MRYGPWQTLVTAAGWAPSGDNMQPWRFVVDEPACTLRVEVDTSRDPSPMNAGQRMARIAVGAAVENIVQTARYNGWNLRLHDGPHPGSTSIELEWSGADPGKIPNAILARLTNRRPYDRRPLPVLTLAQLERQTPATAGVATHWFVERPQLLRLAELVGRADALMFGEQNLRRTFLANVRFDAAAAAVPEGLSLASLEATWADRLALRLMRSLPNWLVRCSGSGRIFAAKGRQWVSSASGLCLVTAPDDREATDLMVGRAMQRAWLALTAAGLAAQPMMSLMVLANIEANGHPSLVESLGRENLKRLRADLQVLVPTTGAERPAFLLRFGWAPAPTGRTGRLPVAAAGRQPWAASGT